jgi:chitin synthase
MVSFLILRVNLADPYSFTMYRLRTADKGKPLLISDVIVKEYADCEVDTLHKKNLLSLGEDRYLTTLMTKHFPFMKYKFIPDAYASTAAPETWSVLLSQRRRWINSTIHNLAELVRLKEMCGFCCFSMRFVVFIDLFGTLILPATCVYLVYLIVTVAIGKSQFPLVSIIMIAAVYGLQAIIFILKRQWQHVGWMIIYLLAFPIYSFILPMYSFWNQDNFSWGNTRIVIGEKGNKQVIAIDDEGFDPRSIPLQRWDDYATANNLPGRRGISHEKHADNPYDDVYEMDDMRSMYSSVKPASTILTGFPARQTYMPPSPAPFGQARQSVYSTNPYTDYPSPGIQRQSMMSLGLDRTSSPYQDNPRASGINLPLNSSDNLIGLGGQHSPTKGRMSVAPGYAGGHRQAISPDGRMTPLPAVDFVNSPSGIVGARNGPDDQTIIDAVKACLREVDLETVTKKQVRALVEQRLQMEIQGERRVIMDRCIDGELANM